MREKCWSPVCLFSTNNSAITNRLRLLLLAAAKYHICWRNRNSADVLSNLSDRVSLRFWSELDSALRHFVCPLRNAAMSAPAEQNNVNFTQDIQKALLHGEFDERLHYLRYWWSPCNWSISTVRLVRSPSRWQCAARNDLRGCKIRCGFEEISTMCY